MSERLEFLQELILDLLNEPGPAGLVQSLRSPSGLKELARGVARLSEIYTRRRESLSGVLLRNPLLRAAYLVYFLPANLSKMKWILREIWAHPCRAEMLGPEVRVLDLGCGSGTHLLGFLDFWAERPDAWHTIRCMGVDAIAHNLADCEALFAPYASRVHGLGRSGHWELQTRTGDLTRWQSLQMDGQFDFVVIGNVLNELYPGERCVERRLNLVSSVAARWLSPQGFLVLVEPALKETSRDLLFLRDRLLDSTDFTVFSPCVHNGHCPAVSDQNQRDWCHEDHPWAPPPLVRQIDAIVGNQKGSLKYSYVVFSRRGISVRDSRIPPIRGSPGRESQRFSLGGGFEVWRVVSDCLKEKGKTSFFLCGARGRMKATRLKKHRSGVNEEFKALERGQVAATAALAIPNEKEARVTPETEVRIDLW